MVRWLLLLAGCDDKVDVTGTATDEADADTDSDSDADSDSDSDTDSDSDPACDHQVWFDTGALPTTRDDALAVAPDDHDGDGSLAGADCDDQDPAVFPGAPERCDGVDTDCDPATSEHGLVTLDAVATYSSVGSALIDASQRSTLRVCPGEYPENLRLGDDVRIVGEGGADAVVIRSASDGDPVLRANADVVLRDLTVRDGYTRDPALYWLGTPGGGVSVGPCGTAVVRDLVATANEAPIGGGLAADGGELYVFGGLITGNGADMGAGVGADEGRVELYGARLEGNTADTYGGGAATIRGDLLLEEVEVIDNLVSFGGGGLYASGGSLTVRGGVIEGNRAGSGGGIWGYDVHIELYGAQLLGNQTLSASPYGGGGVYLDTATVEADSATLVTGNLTEDQGGGVSMRTATWRGGEIRGNEAGRGGGVASLSGPSALDDVLVTGNSASSRGGGLLLEPGGQLTLFDGAQIVANTCSGDGGGAWIESGPGQTLTSDGASWSDNAPDEVWPDGAGASFDPAPGAPFVCDGDGCAELLPAPGVLETAYPIGSPAALGARVAASASHVAATSEDDVTVWTHDGTDWLPTHLPVPAECCEGLAISETHLAFGAILDPAGGVPSGQVYVYAWDGASWLLEATLAPPTPVSSQWFGWSLALQGSTLAIGAPGDGTGGNQSGAVYVFDEAGGSWSWTATLYDPTPAAYDGFGEALALDAAAQRLLVGTPGDDTVASDSGSVEQFDDSSGTWLSSSTLLPTSGAAWSFGQALALSEPRLAVGAANAVALYQDDPLGWLEQDTLTVVEQGAYGWSVALQGSTLVVGAPFMDTPSANAGRIYVYDDVDAPVAVPVTRTVPVASDYLGWSVALQDDTVWALTTTTPSVIRLEPDPAAPAW